MTIESTQKAADIESPADEEYLLESLYGRTVANEIAAHRNELVRDLESRQDS